MLVHRPRPMTQGAAAVTVAMLALGACDDPAARTDLRPEGDPEVLAVLVLNDALGGLVESATHCKVGDEKRPGLVGLPDFTTQQICPENLAEDAPQVANAAPELWYVRIVFDELLDPNVEDLIPELDENNQETGIYTGTLRNTQPVTLQCEDVSGVLVDVDYDGYYSPSGNNVTWPLGPSLVIKPLDPTIIPVESRCQVTLKEGIKDKSTNSVPEGDRGPFSFRIAPVQVIAISPEPDEEVNPEFGGVDLTFNVEVDTSTLDDTMFQFEPAMTNTGVYQYSSTGVFLYGDMLDSKSYKFKFAPGTKIKDKCGKESVLAGDNLETNFDTSALELVNIIPFQGPGAVPSRKIRINFNQVMDKSTLVEGTDYEWVGGEKPELPTATTPVLTYDPNDESIIIVNGTYKLGTNYKFHIKAGAKIKDCPSEATIDNCTTSPGELALEEQTIDITMATAMSNTAASIGAGSTGPRSSSITTISGSGGQTVHKVSETENVFVRLSFNQDMAGASLDSTEFKLTKADDTPTGIALPAAGSGTASTVTLNMGALPAGTYKFTLKQGATINDRHITPVVYTQAADKVFTFVVSVDPPPPFSCLGAP